MSPVHKHSKGVAPTIETAPSPPLGRRVLASLTWQLCAAALIALLALVPTATTSHATSCRGFDPAILTALCEDGVCTEGFGIGYVLTGYACRRRPVVRELSETSLGLFAESARHSYHQHFSGIFETEVEHSCLGRGWWREECTTPMRIRKLSESVDPQTLDAYRSEGLETERQASHRNALWTIAADALVVTILVIGWPWALGALIPAIRRRVGWALLVAIPIQLFTGLSIAVHAWGGIFTVPVLLKVSDTICVIAIVVAIPVQLAVLIRRKIRARAKPA